MIASSVIVSGRFSEIPSDPLSWTGEAVAEFGEIESIAMDPAARSTAATVIDLEVSGFV
jgi:hypothetical protein